MDGHKDDRRMHEGRHAGLEGHRGHEHHEDPVTDADRIGRRDETPPDGAVDDVSAEAGNGGAGSALGGGVATHSGTAEKPADERLG